MMYNVIDEKLESHYSGNYTSPWEIHHVETLLREHPTWRLVTDVEYVELVQSRGPRQALISDTAFMLGPYLIDVAAIAAHVQNSGVVGNVHDRNKALYSLKTAIDLLKIGFVHRPEYLVQQLNYIKREYGYVWDQI